MMREAFQDVSPCRTTTTSVNSLRSPSAVEEDDIPTTAAPCTSLQEISGARADPAGRDTEATADRGEVAKAAPVGGGEENETRDERAGGGD
jgi:hypothetical protein